MPLAVSAIWSYVQELSMDNAAASNFLTLSTDGYPLLNRAYRMVAGKTSKRTTLEDATTLGTVISQALLLSSQWRMFLTPQTISDVKDVFYAGSTGIDNQNLSVTCSSAGSTATLTTAASFLVAQVLQGMRVSHANIPSRTFVKSIESATSLTLSDKSTGVISAAAVSFRPVAGIPLQQEDYGRVMRLIQSQADSGTPAIYGLRRAQAATLDGVGNIEVIVYPIPDGGVSSTVYQTVYFPMEVRYQIATLSAATDVVDVEDGEDYLIGEIVAYWSLVMQGRNEMASAALQRLPDAFRDAAVQAAKTLPMKVPVGA